MKGTTALLPTSYFPSLLYLKVINTYEASIEVHETYQKRTMRNRANILTANGPYRLSVPLKKGKTQSKITDTKISFDEDWQTLHLKHLRSAYGSAPYYEHYIDEIKELIENCPELLIELNFNILNFFKNLGYCKSWGLTSSYSPIIIEKGLDYRNDKIESWEEQRQYHQVFDSKFGFINELSSLDLLFNVGPEGRSYL